MLRIRLLSLRACLISLTVAAAQFAATQPAPRIEYPQKRLIDITDYLKSAHDLSGDSITDFFFIVGNPWLPGGVKVVLLSEAAVVLAQSTARLAVSWPRPQWHEQ